MNVSDSANNATKGRRIDRWGAFAFGLALLIVAIVGGVPHLDKNIWENAAGFVVLFWIAAAWVIIAGIQPVRSGRQR
jgi:hypothetical protein